MSSTINDLKSKRKTLGLTQEQAAKRLGISRRSYQNYEYSNYKDLDHFYDELLARLDSFSLIDKTHGILTIKQIKTSIEKVFIKYPQVEFAYLFGSYSRGEAKETSDVDILIYAPNFGGFKYIEMFTELKEALNKDVDLVSLSQILDNEKFLSEILSRGIKIWGKNN